MLSLYIKLLEGERGTVTGKKVMPRLNDNIRCGNSLIGMDIYQQMELFDNGRRLRPFHWESESKGFGAILKAGGFDAVIGNPPYLFITELSETEKRYFFERYKTSEYRFDVYGLFTELALSRLVKRGGYLGFIVPRTLLSNDSFEKLRKFILEHTRLKTVVDIGPGVF